MPVTMTQEINTMKITLNGEKKDFSDGITVTDLLEQVAAKGPLAVEVNRQICPKKTHTQTILQGGDIVEIVTIVGGG